MCRGATGMMACELPDERGLNAWLSVDPTQDVNLGNPGALLFAVPIAVKNDLYGVILIEEGSRWIALPLASTGDHHGYCPTGRACHSK